MNVNITARLTTTDREPAFWIGKVPIMGDLMLAPMVGFSDVPYRLICREYGSAMSYTPLLLDLAINQLAKRIKPLAEFVDGERPVAVQLVSNDAGMLTEATGHIASLGPEIIDLNVGCPARKVVSRGRGAALLKTPKLLAELATAMVAATDLPVTAKIRLGWDAHSRNHVEVAHILEDCGMAAIAVHGRTRAQGYGGQADWDAIAEVKRAVNVPVLANGDVTCVDDIKRIKEVTGCEGVLIGRGAVGNPWIFQRRDLADVPYHERLAMMERHLLTMVAHDGPELGVILFRKHVVKYTRGLDGSAAIRARMVRIKGADELLELLHGWQPHVAAP